MFYQASIKDYKIVLRSGTRNVLSGHIIDEPAIIVKFSNFRYDLGRIGKMEAEDVMKELDEKARKSRRRRFWKVTDADWALTQAKALEMAELNMKYNKLQADAGTAVPEARVKNEQVLRQGSVGTGDVKQPELEDTILQGASAKQEEAPDAVTPIVEEDKKNVEQDKLPENDEQPTEEEKTGADVSEETEESAHEDEGTDESPVDDGESEEKDKEEANEGLAESEDTLDAETETPKEEKQVDMSALQGDPK